MSNTEPLALRAVENLSRDLQDARISLTRDIQEVRTRSETMELRVEDLEQELTNRLQALEMEMGTMNAHLDNIARESAITNDLLRKDMEHRHEMEKARHEQERVEKERLREEDAQRRADKAKVIKKVVGSIWAEVKTPFSTLITAAAIWAAYTYFHVSDEQAKAAPELPAEVAGGSLDESTP